jgi:hypothetical protein
MRRASPKLFFFFTLSALCQGLPAGEGVYVQQLNDWQQMSYTSQPIGFVATFSHFVLKNDGGIWYHPYRGAHAAISVKGPKPVFTWNNFNQGIAPHSVLIVRLMEKRDRRELATSMVESVLRFLPEDCFSVQIQDDGNRRTASPEVDLMPGEYMLVTGHPVEPTLGPGQPPLSVATFTGLDFRIVK